jgi:hypothetical protein
MSAIPYTSGKTPVSGYYVSEKLPGLRAFWDGGLSRGVPTLHVPFAGLTDPKTSRVKEAIPPTATGLWTACGNPILAPSWFLNKLPCMPLDGVIFIARDSEQYQPLCCSEDSSGFDWSLAEFAVFGTPPLGVIFGKGRIKNSRMVRDIWPADIKSWLKTRTKSYPDFTYLSSKFGRVPFEYELTCLQDSLAAYGRVYLLRQRKLPSDAGEAEGIVKEELQRVLARRGLGVMLRNPDSPWLPKQVTTLLKCVGV